MAGANNTRQGQLERTAKGEHKDAVVELTDKNATILKEGDILVNFRTGEKLTILGDDEFSESIRYYSFNERDEGLHDPTFLPECFDIIARASGEAIETIPLEKAE